MCTHPLKLVIDRAAQILMRVLDDGHHIISSVAFTEPEREAVAQSADRGFALEAGEARAQHELHGRDELERVWAESEESGDAELLEESVTLRVAPAHQDDHFVIQLERARLELDTAGTCTLFRQYRLRTDRVIGQKDNLSMSNKNPKSYSKNFQNARII